MRHLDEHTMAFYAMGAELPPAEKEAIESHLGECYGCRAQVEELRGIDRHVAETVDPTDPSDDAQSAALVPFPRALGKRVKAAPVRLKSRGLSPAVRLATVIRRHPVGAGSLGLMMALLAFFSLRLVTTKAHHNEPERVQMNAAGTALDVYGNNEKIFEIEVSANATPPERERRVMLCTHIGDLDGDGKAEVVTGAPFYEGEREVSNVVRVYNGEGEPIARWPLGHSIDYRTTPYSNSFGIAGLWIRPGVAPGKPELLVGLNNERSPSCVLRLDQHGKTIGEYWHFGWLHGPQGVQLHGESGGLVLLVGVNDVEYRENISHPVVVVLDPTKLSGPSESSQSGGFGYPTSAAEIYYARAGNVDSSLVSNTRVLQPSFGPMVRFSPDSSFTAFGEFFVPHGFPAVLYTFDNHLAVRDVWLSDHQRIELIGLYLTNKTPEGQREFQNDLKSKVEYWDGTRWKKEPAKVSHTSPPS